MSELRTIYCERCGRVLTGEFGEVVIGLNYCEECITYEEKVNWFESMEKVERVYGRGVMFKKPRSYRVRMDCVITMVKKC